MPEISFAEASGAAPTPGSPPTAPAAPSSGIAFGDASGTAAAPPDSQPNYPSFGTRALKVLEDNAQSSVDHPIEHTKGMAKAVGSGIVSLAEMAAQGIAGISTSIVAEFKALGKGDFRGAFDLTKGFDTGADFVAEKAKNIRNLTTSITKINLAPEGKSQQAAADFLALIPQGIDAAGDTVYDKTGSALAGSGSKALLTLLSLKGSEAAKMIKSTMSKGNPAGRVVQTTFDELAKKDPAGAQAIADHVGPADPELKAHLEQSIQGAKDEAPEIIGRRQAQAQTGTITENPSVVHSVEEATGEHTVKSPNGELIADEGSKAIQVKRIDVDKKAQGAGEGTMMMERLIAEAGKRGKNVESDVSVSPAMEGVYRKLGQQGYKIIENPSERSETTGNLVSKDPRKGVFTIQVDPVKKAVTTEEAGADLRSTVRQGYEDMAKVGVERQVAPQTGLDGSQVHIPKPDPVLYMDRGKAVTRGQVEGAFTFGNTLRKVPGVAMLEGKLREYFDQGIRTFNPEALGPEAKSAGAILAKNISEQMQKDSAYFHRSAQRRAFWNYRAEEAQDFINGFEKGKKFADPVLNKAAEGYRAWNAEIAAKEESLGFKYDPTDNYLYHLFENPEGVVQYMNQRFGPKWNNPKFMKDRAFGMYEDAIKAGFKPRFANPEDIMLARQHASDVAEMRVQVLRDMKKYGLAEEIENSNKRPLDFPATEWRAPNGERYWVHNSASAVLHNAFNTKSLWNLQGIGGDAFRGAMRLKNAIVPIRLAVSLFHPIHVATIDNATGMVRATKELLAGKSSPSAWLGQMGKAAVYRGIIDNPKGGYRVLKAWQGRVADKDLTVADKQALQYITEGGMIPEMSSQYRMQAVAAFKSALQRGSASALWHLPFAAIDAIQRPMFEVWIPSLKIASYLKDVQTAIKTDPSLIDNPLKRQLAFRRISKSVDNRYGEMAYNTLFWNRWVRDLAVANTLSLGWQMGFIREYGGGMLDVGQAVRQPGSLPGKVATGMLDRPMFVSFYTTQALAYGGLMTWALSGQFPQSLMDYVYPKTGGTDRNGKPKRVSTMFYPREFMAIYKHVQNQGAVEGLGALASNKSSGLIGMAHEWASGVNSFGQEIADPNAPLYKNLSQKLAYTLSDLEPISLKAISESGGSIALSAAGFTPAPKYITNTKTEGAIEAIYDKYYAQKQTPFEKAQYSADAKKLKILDEKGEQEKVDALLDKMQDEFQLTPKEMVKLQKSIRSDSDPHVTMFKRMTWQQQKRVLDQMTEEEREVYLPHSNKEHLRGRYQPPEENE